MVKDAWRRGDDNDEAEADEEDELSLEAVLVAEGSDEEGDFGRGWKFRLGYVRREAHG